MDTVNCLSCDGAGLVETEETYWNGDEEVVVDRVCGECGGTGSVALMWYNPYTSDERQEDLDSCYSQRRR